MSEPNNALSLVGAAALVLIVIFVTALGLPVLLAVGGLGVCVVVGVWAVKKDRRR